MKKHTLIFVAGLLAANAVSAQIKETDNVKKNLSYESKDTVAWVHGGMVQLGINQGFQHNWQAGGEIASLQIDGIFSGNITRLYHSSIWSNTLEANYSLFYAYSNNFVPRKVNDRIDLTSKYGSRINSSNLFVTGLFNFRSQFTKGYDYGNDGWDTMATSNFLSPAYLTLAAGIEYRNGPDLSLFLSPVAARITVADKYYTLQTPAGRFGIEYGKTSRFELGAYFSGRWQHNFAKNITYKTRLDLYANYLAKDRQNEDGTIAHDNPGNIDILWDNLLQMKLSKYFALSLGITMMYDNDIPYESTRMENGVAVPKDEVGNGLGWLQVRQVMTLGLSYKF